MAVCACPDSGGGMDEVQRPMRGWPQLQHADSRNRDGGLPTPDHCTATTTVILTVPAMVTTNV